MRDSSMILFSFLESADHIIYENAKVAATRAWENIINPGNDNDVINTTLAMTLPLKNLDEMVSVAEELNTTVIENLNYLKNMSSSMVSINQLRDMQLKLVLSDEHEIRDIKIKYIDQYLDTITQMCAEILDGKSAKEFTDQLSDPVYLKKLKEQAVVSTLPSYMKNKDIVGLRNQEMTNVDISTIQKRVIPFLVQYSTVKVQKKSIGSALEDTSFRQLAVQVNGTVNAATKKFSDIRTTMVRVSTENDLDRGKVSNFLYVATTQYLELMKFVVAMALRHIQTYIFNVIQINSVVSRIRNRIPETRADKMISESVDYEHPFHKLNAIDLSPISLAALNLRPEVELALENYDVEEAGYDESVYKIPISVCVKLSNFLDRFVGISVHDKDLPIQNIFAKIGDFQDIQGVIHKYFDTERVSSLSFLEKAGYSPVFLLCEIDAMIENFPKISQYMRDLVYNMENSKVKLVESTLYNKIRMDECVVAIDTLMTAFSKYREDLAKIYADRLARIESAIPAPRQESVMIDDSDLLLEEAETIFSIMEDCRDEDLRGINEHYSDIYLQQKMKYFFEDDQQNGGDKPSEGSDSGKPADTPKTSDSGDNNSTTPKVTDNTEEEKKSGDNTSENKGDANSEGNTENLKEKIQEFVQKAIDAAKGFLIKQRGAEKNLAFLSKNKDALINRSYDGASAQLIQYAEIDYVKIVNGIITKATSFDDNFLKTADEKRLYDKLFAETSFNQTPSGSGLKERLTIAFQSGAGKVTMKTFSGSALKSEIPKMIKFCEDYYSGIQKDLEELKKNSSKIDSLSGKKGTGNGNNTSSNIAKIQTAITSTISAMISVTKKRSNDYMIILDKFQPKLRNKTEDTGNSGSDNSSESNNSGENKEENSSTENTEEKK